MDSLLDQYLNELSANELRRLVIKEISKFTRSLKGGCTIEELEKERENVRKLMDVLNKKEQQEKASVTSIYPSSKAS